MAVSGSRGEAPPVLLGPRRGGHQQFAAGGRAGSRSQPLPAHRRVTSSSARAGHTTTTSRPGSTVTSRPQPAGTTTTTTPPTTVVTPPPSAGGVVTVSVDGNELVNGAGQPIRLLGVDRSGTEYACIQGWGIFDGPSDAASVAAMKSWHIDAVRVPLNEDCWLGINGVSARYGGAAYRAAVAGYVHTLQAAGLVVILDLHWNAPGSEPATGQQEMADADHSPAFWRSVASYFKSNHGLVFDLYNEPNGISWSCWLNGCVTSGGWEAAGMQSLVDAVRSTGATQPLMLGGLAWSNDLSQWLRYEPKDPLHELVASIHVYNFNACSTVSCWNETIAPVARQVPVVTGELGENDCASGFIDSYMEWADEEGVSYLGWTWDTGGGWTCTNGPSLITSYAGTPTPFGAGLEAHLAELAARGREGPFGQAGGSARSPAASAAARSHASYVRSTPGSGLPESTSAEPVDPVFGCGNRLAEEAFECGGEVLGVGKASTMEPPRRREGDAGVVGLAAPAHRRAAFSAAGRSRHISTTSTGSWGSPRVPPGVCALAPAIAPGSAHTSPARPRACCALVVVDRRLGTSAVAPSEDDVLPSGLVVGLRMERHETPPMRREWTREPGREDESALPGRQAESAGEGDSSPLCLRAPSPRSAGCVGTRGPWALQRPRCASTPGDSPLPAFLVSRLDVRRAVELGQERSGLARRGGVDPWAATTGPTCRGSSPRSGGHHQALPAVCDRGETPHASPME
jgi:endoglucanase